MSGGVVADANGRAPINYHYDLRRAIALLSQEANRSRELSDEVDFPIAAQLLRERAQQFSMCAKWLESKGQPPPRLWLLKLDSENAIGCEWDSTHGFVVEAGSEEEARAVAHKNGADENKSWGNPWLDPEKSSCVPLVARGGAGRVVLEDHRAG